MPNNCPIRMSEKGLRQDGMPEIIDLLRKKYGREYRRYCIRSLHNSITFGWELPRRVNGSKLGLKKRIDFARAEGMQI